MATPQDFCDQILKSVHSSNLHFLVQESPFSLYITLRKKFAIQTPGANSNLDSDNQLILARDTIKILEDKLAHTESEFVKECNKVKVKREEFSEEIIILRESLKKSQTETNEKNKVISDLNKSAKAKDKELYNVEKKCNLATDTSKQLKDKVVQLKRDHSEAARSIKNNEKKGKIDKEKLEQKVKTLEQKLNSMNSNNNNTVKQVQITPSVSLNTASSTACTFTLPASSPHTPRSKATPLATIPVFEAATFSTIISPSSSLSTSCPALSLPSTSQSTPNPRSSLQSPPRPVSPHTPPGTPPPRSTASPASTPPPPHLCQHTPQCVQRQPKPPPPEKSSVLVHTGSLYHEHFMSHGVPARYGPHDDCMAVDNNNYGCGDCIWFKRWGELHGYPDLTPWKYVASGNYSDQLDN